MICFKIFSFERECKMNNLFGLIAILSISLILGCAGNKNTISKKNSDGDVKALRLPTHQIPPGHCRITGTIISIDSTLEKGSSKDPCSIKPCNAVVKIDSIIGYGSSFPPLQLGGFISIHFYFTLSATNNNLFPALKVFYPGLSAGSSFIGDVTVLRELNKGFKQRRYGIYDYKKIK